MKLVIIETPFSAEDPALAQSYVLYAQECLKHSLSLGEAPLASHLLYTQVLDDKQPEQRKQGIEAGLAWGKVADYTVVYEDMGISKGMKKGIARAIDEGREVIYRRIKNNHVTNMHAFLAALLITGKQIFCEHFETDLIDDAILQKYFIDCSLHDSSYRKEITYTQAGNLQEITKAAREILEYFSIATLADKNNLHEN